MKNTHEIIKYFFEMEIQFYRRRAAESEEETDFQYTTAAFSTPLMTTDQLSVGSAIVIGQLMPKITEFGCENNCMILCINYLRPCWCYCRRRPLMHGTFIPMPKWLTSKRAIVNVQSFDDNTVFNMQY